MKYENHLIDPVRCILDTAEEPLSEYQIIQQLKAQEWLPELSMADTVSLYSAHFLVYNALFQLRETYQEQGKQLFISALSIYWYPEVEPVVLDTVAELAVCDGDDEARHELRRDASSASSAGVSVNTSSTLSSCMGGRSENQAGVQELASYYLNWQHLEQATQDSVDALLSSFWERFDSASTERQISELYEQEYIEAIDVLGVESHSPYSEIKRRYRQLVMEHHPDRQGDKSMFQAIQSAFSFVRRYRQQGKK